MISCLRKKARRNELTLKEYETFLDDWYPTVSANELKELLAFIENQSMFDVINVRYIVAKKPVQTSHPSFFKYYLYLYKFLSSKYPAGPHPNSVARVLAGYMKKNNLNADVENTTGLAYATVYKKRMTFYIGSA